MLALTSIFSFFTSFFQQRPHYEDKPSPLDLLLIHDATASQQPYLNATIKVCKEVCSSIKNSGKVLPGGFRLGLVAFRDHPPQDTSFVTKDFGGFTHNIDEVQLNLNKLTAKGGGDYPEAVTAALAKALQLKWNDAAAKVIILITDAPPHGIGEDGDGFPNGDPNGHNPTVLAEEMKKRGIVLLVVACEPILSGCFKYAHDFYQALTQITFGSMFPLTRTDLLSTFIIGSALQNVVYDSLVREFQTHVRERRRDGVSIDEITGELHSQLEHRGQQITTLETNDIYVHSPEAKHNLTAFLNMDRLSDLRKTLRQVMQGRFVPDYNWSAPPPAEFNIPITFKNTSDHYISYEYFGNDGKRQEGVAVPAHFNIMQLSVNKPYNFTLTRGRETKTTGRAFSRVEDEDLAKYFY